jgi:hypothetical protein
VHEYVQAVIVPSHRRPLPKAAPTSSTITTTTLEEGKILSQEASDAKPILTSDVLPDSEQLAQEAVRRIQEEVDRIESQRDREDGTFSLTAPEDESQTQEYLEFNESPRRRSRRHADYSDAKMPPVRQTLGQSRLRLARSQHSKYQFNKGSRTRRDHAGSR